MVIYRVEWARAIYPSSQPGQPFTGEFQGDKTLGIEQYSFILVSFSINYSSW